MRGAFLDPVGPSVPSASPARIAVLADDVAGAHASATLLRSAGLRAGVIWSEAPSSLTAGDALVIDMRTRDRPSDPRGAARQWARFALQHGFQRLELRMDSTLRGSTHEELRGVLDVVRGDPTVLVVPACPSAGRTTVSGRQKAPPGVPVAHGGDVRAAGAGDLPCEILDRHVLRRGSRATFRFVTQSRERGTRCFIADGTCEADLRCIAAVASALESQGHELITVSPGPWLTPRPVRTRSLPSVAPPRTIASNSSGLWMTRARWCSTPSSARQST